MNKDITGPVDKVTDVVVDLGPRIIMAGSEVLGTSDNISIEVAESTEEELDKLTSAYEIRLVKVLDTADDKINQDKEEYRRMASTPHFPLPSFPFRP